MKVTIDNFQSLGHVELDLQGLTVITGPSDRGKSALVRAIEGALFNLPGDYFVRTGAQFAGVELEWPGHKVVWAKGGGKNLFEIDGQTYAKVGKDAPPRLQELGFRDELIGARQKEDGSTDGGKWVRPQIAHQFDGIYLLDEPGPFINEVIVKLSRLGVLQRALRQCSLDHRQAKALLKTREGDLKFATDAAEQLAEAPRLRARLDALVTHADEIDEQRRLMLAVRGLVERRASALARSQRQLPAVAVSPETVAGMVQQYQQIPQVRAQLARRARLKQLPKALPAAKVLPDSPAYAALQEKATQYTRLASLVGMRIMRATALTSTELVLKAATQRVQEAMAAVERFREESPLCPVCARPWAESPVGV